jgi:hypothetical protein
MAQVHCVLKPRNIRAELARWSLQGWMEWREWDGEFVLRSDSTAATLVLPHLAGETIKALRDGPAHVDQIAARLFHDTVRPSAATAALVATFTDTANETRRLLDVLTELEDLGLVRADLA